MKKNPSQAHQDMTAAAQFIMGIANGLAVREIFTSTLAPISPIANVVPLITSAVFGATIGVFSEYSNPFKANKDYIRALANGAKWGLFGAVAGELTAIALATATNNVAAITDPTTVATLTAPSGQGPNAALQTIDWNQTALNDTCRPTKLSMIYTNGIAMSPCCAP